MAQINNILIGAPGVAGQNNTIMVGTHGTQTATYISGIYGQTIGAINAGVVVDSDDKLGSLPSFSTKTKLLYIQETTAINVTGDGTIYTLGTSIALTKIFDVNNDMTTSGIFTAPTNGYYNFTIGICLNNLAASPDITDYESCSNGGIQIVVTGTSANTYQVTMPWSMINGGGEGLSPDWLPGCDQQSGVFTCLVQMTAGDTATFTGSIIGVGALTNHAAAKITGIGPIGTNSYTNNSTFVSCFREL